jgi:hypothetical protein
LSTVSVTVGSSSSRTDSERDTAATDQGTNTGVLLGLVLAGLMLLALFYFGARNWSGFSGSTTAPEAGAGQSGQSNTFAPEVDVPKDVNVNVNPQGQ